MPEEVKQASIITPQRVIYAIRNRFNPIRGFTPEKLAGQLDQFHAGEIKDAARTWDAMERRDVNLGNVAAKRKKSVARLPWEIMTVDDSAEAKAQAEFLEDLYNNLRATSVLEQNERGGIRLLIRQMMDAVGKRFAVHEMVWVPPGAKDSRGIINLSDGPVLEFRFCPLWWFENKTGTLRFLPEEGALDGEPMAPGGWLVTVGEGIMEGCAVMYVFKHNPLKDWMAYSEKFGMPGVLGKTNAASGSPEWEAMEEAVAAFCQDWAAVSSATDTIEFIEAKGGSNNLPYPPLVEYCDRAMAARWRGADLSTMSQGKEGVGASLQGDETNLLLEDDAGLITEILNEQVDRAALEWRFGAGVECKAYFKLQGTISTPEDEQFRRAVVLGFLADRTVGDIIANQTDLKALIGEVGLPVNEEYVDPYVPVSAEPGPLVTGELVKDPEGDIIGGDYEALTGNDQGLNPNDKEASARGGLGNSAPGGRALPKARREFALATKQALKAVAERLQGIYAMENEALQRVALREFLDAVPALKKHLAGEATTKEQVQALRKALEDGFLKGARERRGN